MKNLCALFSCIVVMQFGFVASAQNRAIPINEPDQNKPRLFENLPDRIPVTEDALNSLLNAGIGRPASIPLTKETNASFDGEVVSLASKYENKIQSVVIRSEQFNGASLTISKILNDDGSYSYRGRIISFKHGDVYELQNGAEGLALVKRNYYDLVNE